MLTVALQVSVRCSLFVRLFAIVVTKAEHVCKRTNAFFVTLCICFLFFCAFFLFHLTHIWLVGAVIIAVLGNSLLLFLLVVLLLLLLMLLLLLVLLILLLFLLLLVWMFFVVVEFFFLVGCCDLLDFRESKKVEQKSKKEKN